MATLRAFGNFRKEISTEEIDIPSGLTLKELIEWLAKNYNRNLIKSIFQNDSSDKLSLSKRVMILINGFTIFDLNHVIKPEDQVAIFPPVAGG